MNWKRLLPFLLLNIFISVCVMAIMLFWYDRTHRADIVLPVMMPLPGSAATLPADLPIEITSVIGAGSLSSEIVLVQYNGEGEVTLTGWRLQDSDGNVYTFPQLTLYKNGAVQVHSAAGVDMVVDLYWGQNQPVWGSGELATLFDSQGAIRATYRIP